MFPIGAVIGAGASIAGGLIGAGAEREAAEKQWQIDLLNYYAQQQRQFQMDQRANRNEADTKLGQTDARGNRTHFVEGVGWVSELSDDDKQLQELYQKEELGQLTNDLPKRRDILNSNVVRQGRENTQADALLNAFQRVERDDGRQTENLMNSASQRGINEGFDGTLQDAMRSAIRSGASNSGKVAAEIGREKSKALSDAFLNNKINAKGVAADEFATEQGNIANIYNMFASRASAMPDASFNPRNIEGMAAQQQAGSMGAGNAASNAVLNALARPAATLDAKIRPLMGMANAITSGGQALGAAFDRYGAERSRSSAMSGYDEYAGYSPDMYRRSSGDF